MTIAILMYKFLYKHSDASCNQILYAFKQVISLNVNNPIQFEIYCFVCDGFGFKITYISESSP